MEAQALSVLDGHACLLGGGRLRPPDTLGGQARLGWPRCLVRGLALLQSGGLPCWCSRLAALLHADTEWCRAWSHLEPSNRSSKLPRDPRGDHTGDFSTRSTAAGSEAAMGRTASPTRASPRMCNRRRTLCRSEGKGGRSDHPRPIRRWSSLDQPRGEIQRWSQLQRRSQLQRGLHFQGLILLLQR